MNIDIKFIAKKAGVSPATVSRVMNRTKSVSPELKEKVMAIVQKYNYHPNSMARGLILKKSCLIGVMTPNVSNAFHAKMISAIETQANAHGYNVLLANVHNDFARQKQSFLGLCERQVDGIIMLHENTREELEQLQSLSSIPMVLASIHVPECALPAVAIDDRQAAEEAVRYLISLGHKRIAGIFNNCYSLGVLRKEGYINALKATGLPVDESIIAFTECTIESGAACAAGLFQTPNPPTALFCVSDEIAIGAIDWLSGAGYQIPQDISVIGFDDIILAKVFRPRLTTVHQPIHDIGQKAAALLIALLEEKQPEQNQVLLPYQIIIRDSCKECRQ